MNAAEFGGKVLVVDDDPGVRGLLSQILSDSGRYEADVAADGVEALAKARHGGYDVIFTDLTMPRMNGMEFLRTIRQVDAGIPVVVITGTQRMEIAIAAMREGASDFITKPFRVDKIVATADRILGERRLLGRVAAPGRADVPLQRLNAELFRRLQEIVTLHSLSTDVDRIHDNKEIFERVAEMAARLLCANDVSFGIVDGGVLRIRSAIGGRRGDEIRMSGSVFEEVVRNRRFRVADVGERDPFSGGVLSSECLVIPLIVAGDVIGILSLSNKSDGTAFSEEDIHLADSLAKKVASRIESNALYDVLFHNLVDTLRSLVATIEARDPYTRNHSERVTKYAVRIACEMGLCSDDLDTIRFGGYLHDIGKIGVRDSVLLKPGRLTDAEFAEIRRHSLIGDEIVRPLKLLTRERELIRSHHEHFDGRGYPDGIAKERIPQLARILAAADAYDAMTSTRPYRQRKTHEFAMQELKRCAGTQFDPEIVAAVASAGPLGEDVHGA